MILGLVILTFWWLILLRFKVSESYVLGLVILTFKKVSFFSFGV